MVLQLLTQFTYLGIFGLLVAAGVGFPFPEELTQLTAGFLANRGIVSFWPALAATYAGIVTGDYLLFRLGRAHGPKLLESRHIARVVTPHRRAFIERHFARHSILTVMVARHASGLRLPTFVLAGASGVKGHAFLLADGLSALVSVPIVVTLGFLFAHELDRVKRHIHLVELGLLAAIAVALLIGVLSRRRTARRRAAEAHLLAQEAEEPSWRARCATRTPDPGRKAPASRTR